MKKQLTFLLAFAVAGLIFVTSCDGNEDPEIVGSIEITIAGLPDGGTASITVSGPNGYTSTIDASGTLSDLALGLYTFTVSPVDANNDRYIADEAEIAVNIDSETPESVEINFAEFSTVNGIVGTWVSKGENVATLLTLYFSVDSIVAEFSSNMTYTVLQYSGGNVAPLTLSGTYTQSLSSVDAIWEIQVDQTSPSALTSQGIFEIDASQNPDFMQYEIVQTSPDIGATPPTPVDGFGSTSGGAFGTTNIQKYVRRAY